MNELLKSPDTPIRSKGNLPHTHLTRTQPSSILSVPYIILHNMKRSNILIESTKTTSMEDVSTGVLEKINNIWEVKIKPKMIWCNKTYTIAYVKIQKMKLSIMSNLQPNCCLKIDFQKVDKHAGGKWLIHDTKRCKDNQLQSRKLPCRISKLSS